MDGEGGGEMTAASVATIILIGVFLLLIFLRVPVVYAIGIASLLVFIIDLSKMRKKT